MQDKRGHPVSSINVFLDLTLRITTAVLLSWRKGKFDGVHTP